MSAFSCFNQNKVFLYQTRPTELKTLTETFVEEIQNLAARLHKGMGMEIEVNL